MWRALRSIAAVALAAGLGAPSLAQTPADPFAAFVKVSQQVDIHGQPVTVDLLIDGEDAAIRFRDVQNAVLQQSLLDDVTLPLSVLADRRLSFLWAPLEQWAGIGLEAQRDRIAGKARLDYQAGLSPLRPRSASESTTRLRVRSILRYAAALGEAGRYEEALALLTRERDAIDRKTDWGRIEWTSLSLRRATILVSLGDPDGAIAGLVADAAVLGTKGGYAINFDVNRAALLAEQGRYAEALALIDRARADFSATSDGKAGKGGEKVPGSLRQFDWIRACALNGLGKGAEARALLDATLRDAEPRDWAFVVASNQSLRWRAAVCFRDSAMLAGMLVEELKTRPFASMAGRVLQPKAVIPGTPPLLIAAVRADAGLIAAAKDVVRTLPPTYDRALVRWRDAPSSPAPKPQPVAKDDQSSS